MKLPDSVKKAWSEEYKRQGIPSSFRKDPTKPVVEFISWLKLRNFNGLKAADIGCGLGRNSFYLAAQGFEVTGIELLEENVKAINEEAQSKHLPIHAFSQDASSDWPIAINSLDIAIDVFCYKHIVNKEKQLNYRSELWKSLKSDGFYFLSLASEKDGFYGPLIETSPDPKNKLIIDPHSNIPSFLYSLKDVQKEFSDLFEVVEIHEQISTSPMYGQEYPRAVLNAILKKRE